MTKALVGTIAAGAMAMTSAAPAQARDNNGIGAGEIIAGALIIGGIAAVAAAASDNDRDDYRYGDRYGYGDRYDRYGYGDRYDRRGNPRQAVSMCVNTTERVASRNSYGRAKVTDVRKVKSKNGGYDISGRVAVNNMGRKWRSGDRRYGNGWDNDYRGWNDNYRGYDSGKFTCKVRYGRVVDVDFKNIRGL
ncbi:MAG: hypothetical protein AB7U34_01745 [Novosphingobium sp.]